MNILQRQTMADRQPVRSKLCPQWLVLAAVGVLSLGINQANAATVYVDSSKSWIGYMNVFDLPADGGAYQFGSAWGTADLDANFSSGTLTITPNTSIDRDNSPTDTFWWKSDTDVTLTDANKNMDASMYVQDDTLAGQSVTFTGLCQTNALVSPYTCVAFIKDFAPDYSSSTSMTVGLTNGTPFSITLVTSPGDHIQYGFETIGPDARLADVASLGAVTVKAVTSAQVYVDPSQNWIGYMNVFDLSMNYLFGYVAPTADLDANFAGNVAELTPCTSIFRDHPTNDTAWWNSDGTGNKNMDASFYVQDGTLPGKIVTFSGFVWTNSLVVPYTSQAFIKELDPNNGYALVAQVLQPFTNGVTNFSITLPTADASLGHIIQYGFETVGPNANLDLTPLASLGHVLVASNTQPMGPIISSLLPASPVYINASSNVSFTTVATGVGAVAYQWKKDGVNLSNGAGISGANAATLNLTDVTAASEGNYTVVVTDTTTNVASVSLYLVVFNPTNLVFDPSATLNGYINTFYIASDVSSGGFSYPTAQLRASVTNGVVLLQPNNDLYDGNTGNIFWVYTDGTPNQLCEQDYYIGNDALTGLPVTFAGYCQSNNLDPSYTAVAWIKDLAPDYSTNLIISVPLIAGQPFSVSHTSTPGNHVQYGYYILGPDNSSTNPVTQGVVIVSLPSAASPMMTASRAAGVTTLKYAAINGHRYTVEYKTNLTYSTWQPLSVLNCTSSSPITVTDNTVDTQRFYRLSIQ